MRGYCACFDILKSVYFQSELLVCRALMHNDNNRNTVDTLYLIIPCYNEEACLEITIDTVSEKLNNLIENKKISPESAIFFVDDGSEDKTWSIVKEQHEKCSMVKGMRLASNRGKESALFAGVREVYHLCDIAICMDADLQHDIDAIDLFLAEREKGAELVCGLKATRGKESFLRKFTAKAFYWLMEKLNAPVMNGHSDYCLMSKEVMEALSEYKETHMMFRGILHQVGFERSYVYFEVKDRVGGGSKMTLRKLLHLSMDAITSFSVMPLQIIVLMGFLISAVSVIMMCRIVWNYFCNITPDGWATITVSIWFLGGVGMLCLAIVGEYIGKIYMETKRRPRYHVKDKLC